MYNKNKKTGKQGILIILMICLSICNVGIGQMTASMDSLPKKPVYKNVIRYNLSGAVLFGFDRYIVFGYERVLNNKQSISVNFGKASLPKVVKMITDSFELSKDKKSSGFNVSVDYRFYLLSENKFAIPHGLYIGPYYSFNKYTRENEWLYKRNSSSSLVTSNSDFTIHTIGFELGYQFILWRHFALDLLMVGPGMGFYNYKAKFEGNVDPAKKEQLLQGLQDLLTQKFPGMNYVFADNEFNADGVLKTNAVGYRYIIHIGYNF